MDIFVALEVILYEAGRDEGFCAELMANRTDRAWLEARGLTGIDARVLQSIPDGALGAMIRGVGAQPVDRRRFLGAVAAAAVAATMTTGLGAEEAPPVTDVVTPADVSGSYEDGVPASGDMAPGVTTPVEPPPPPTVPVKTANPEVEKLVTKGISPSKKVKLKFGFFLATKGVDVDDYSKVVRKRGAAYRHCILKTDFLQGGGSGMITVLLVISPKGKPSVKKLHLMPSHADLHDCLEPRFASLVFPEHDSVVVLDVKLKVKRG